MSFAQILMWCPNDTPDLLVRIMKPVHSAEDEWCRKSSKMKPCRDIYKTCRFWLSRCPPQIGATRWMLLAGAILVKIKAISSQHHLPRPQDARNARLGFSSDFHYVMPKSNLLAFDKTSTTAQFDYTIKPFLDNSNPFGQVVVPTKYENMCYW